MGEIYYVLSTTVLLILSAAELAMLMRAILSWIMPDGEGLLIDLIYMLTEPLILPYRKLFERFGWFQNSPFDIAYLFAAVTLMLVTSAISFF